MIKIEESCLPDLTKKWVHPFCVNWIPHIKFKCNIAKNKIGWSNVGRYDISAIKGKCDICGKESGYVISCDLEGCEKKMHPRCLQEKTI